MEPLLTSLLDAIFGSLAAATGLSDWLRDRLGRDPERLAFRLALTQALTAAAAEFPGANFRYFVETLRDVGGPLLARTLQPASPFPTPAELTQLWLNHLTIDSLIHYRADFERFATLLLTQLQTHLANQPALQWIAQARQQRASHGELQRIAVSLEASSSQSQAQLAALNAEVSRLVATLESLTQPGAHINTGGGAYVAGNAQAGRDWIGRDLTIKNYFVAGLARLVVDYSARIQEFLLEYLGARRKKVPFGGRAAQLAELDTWLADPAAPPYYLLSAEAGRGKSALVCRWLAQLTTHPDLAVIFLPISIRFETATQDVIFAALAARLAAVFGEEMKAAALSAEEWKGVCQSYLRRSLPDGRRLLLILDGLDEAADWTPGRSLFPGDPPDNLRILVTARLRPGEANAQGWATTLGWQSPQLARAATLPPLDRRGVEEALASMGNPLDALATKIDVVGELHRLSEGDPLLVRLYVDELLNQGERVRQLKAEELQAIQPGLAGYFERWWQDQQEQWRKQQRDPIRQEATLRLLLNALSAALGPLTHDNLAALHPDLGDGLLLKRLTQDVNRWLVGDGKSQGYSYSHPRLSYFFWAQLSHAEQAAWEGRFCTWGATTLAALNTEQLDPKAAPVYLLRHYANHLERNQAPAEAFYALISNGWRKAWEELDISYSGFLGDVDQAWKQARQAYEPNQSGQAEALVQQVRSALCRSSIIALGNNMPPELLAQAVQAGLRTPAQALAIAKLAPDEVSIADAVEKLAPHLSSELYDDALTFARTIIDKSARVRALTSLARYSSSVQPHLILGEALMVSRSILNDESRVSALVNLIAQLSSPLRQDVLDEALTIARSIPDIFYRIRALAYLAPHLPTALLQPVFNDALTAARSLWYKDYCADVIKYFAPHLSAELLDDALSIAQTIQNEAERVRALETLAPHLPVEMLDKALAAISSIQCGDVRTSIQASLASNLPPKLLNDTLTEICSTQTEHYRAYALSSIAPYLPTESLNKALTAARSIRDKFYRANALASLMIHLPAETLESALDEIITAFLFIDKEFRAVSLTSVAIKLPTELRWPILTKALLVARYIGDGDNCQNALSNLAPYLPTEVLQANINIVHPLQDEPTPHYHKPNLYTDLSSEEVIEEWGNVCTITDKDDFANALVRLAPLLPPELLGKALVITRTFLNTSSYPSILSSLGPYLSEELLNEALEITHSIWAEHYRSDALSALAPHLPTKLFNKALTIIRAIKDDYYRANALSRLAPYLQIELRQSVFAEALTGACSDQDEFARTDTLKHLIPQLISWGEQAPSAAICALSNTLSVLAGQPRSKFLRDITILIPFILALAGDEAPQAAEGIFHAIQEVYGWWP